MSTLHSYVPRSPLSAFIDSFSLYRGPLPSHPKERSLPNGSLSLIINLRCDLPHLYDPHRPERVQVYSSCIISGAHSEFVLLDTASLTEVLSVQFKPGGTLPFLPFPAGELTNTLLSLDTLWGTEVSAFREQLQVADTLEHRFHLLERFLLARLTPSRSIHPAVQFALASFQHPVSPPSIASLTEQIGLSSTRFIQLFRDAVGLTPKQFSRLVRFQQVLRSVETVAEYGWTNLALRCGYYDQAHFIHDFQKFSGMTPSAYLTQRSEHHNHVPFWEWT